MNINGNKTYIAVFIFAALNGLLLAGVIDQEMYDGLEKVVGLFGIYALRDAIKKAEV